MRNHWLSALIKTIIFLVIVHAIFLLLGIFVRPGIGMFGLPMIWAHWTDSWRDAAIGMIATVVIYLIIFWIDKRQHRIEGE